MKLSTKIIIGVISAFLLIAFLFYYSNNNQTTTTNSIPPNSIPPNSIQSHSTLQLMITDAPINVKNILINISEIRVNFDGNINYNSSAGWYSINEKSQVFDLIALGSSGTSALLGESKLYPGHYNQIRLKINNAFVSTDGTNYVPIKIPSSELKLISGFNIIEGQKLVITLDFQANQSIHQEGQGFIMIPVIKLLSQNVQCVVDSDCPGYIQLNCGNITSCQLNVCISKLIDCPVENITNSSSGVCTEGQTKCIVENGDTYQSCLANNNWSGILHCDSGQTCKNNVCSI